MQFIEIKIKQLLKTEDNSNQLSNFEKAIENCLKLALELPLLWRKANMARKQRIQYLIFPDGIFYNRKKDDYRTPKINLLFSAIPYLTELVERQKNGDLVNFNEIPTWVGPPGIEPGTY
jgi:site-specific DNA recombinase